jgi:hypothetical protein
MATSKAQQALEFFREQAANCQTARDLHNIFFGIGGKVSQLFPTRAEREAFWKTPEFAEIDRIREEFDALHQWPEGESAVR